MIRVVITDDDADVAAVLAAVIAAQRDMQVVGVASTPVLTESMVAEHRPHVVVLDPRLEPAGGDDLVGRLRAIHPSTRLLLHVGSVRALTHRTGGASPPATVPKRLDHTGLLRAIRRLGAQRDVSPAAAVPAVSAAGPIDTSGTSGVEQLDPRAHVEPRQQRPDRTP